MPAFGALPTVRHIVPFAVMGVSAFAAYKNLLSISIPKDTPDNPYPL
jgi:hypothetical protein